MELEDVFESRYVANFHRSEDIWIGLSDRRKEGQWIWETSRKKATYTWWAPGEPNNKGGGNGRANCALIWRHKDKMSWDDRNCDQKKYFVCERGKEGSNIPADTDHTSGHSYGFFVPVCVGERHRERGHACVPVCVCVCVCHNEKRGARRMASTTSDTGDTSSKQQQAQRKENYNKSKRPVSSVDHCHPYRRKKIREAVY